MTRLLAGRQVIAFNDCEELISVLSWDRDFAVDSVGTASGACTSFCTFGTSSCFQEGKARVP